MKAFVGAVSLFLLSFLAQAAAARDWAPTPQTLAQDYVIIEHQTSSGDFIFLMWIVPEMVPATEPGAAQVRRVLDRYLLIGLVHMRVNDMGLMEPVVREDPRFRTFEGTEVEPLPDERIPPMAQSVFAAMQSAFSQNLGVFGEHVKWRTYYGTGVTSCGSGGFFYDYDGESYDYETPIPGC
jgi:hypothetical protein